MTGFHLNLSLMTPGHFRHAWRLPHADPLAYLDIDQFQRLAPLLSGYRAQHQPPRADPSGRRRHGGMGPAGGDSTDVGG